MMGEVRHKHTLSQQNEQSVLVCLYLKFIQAEFTVFPAGSLPVCQYPTATHHDCTWTIRKKCKIKKQAKVHLQPCSIYILLVPLHLCVCCHLSADWSWLQDSPGCWDCVWSHRSLLSLTIYPPAYQYGSKEEKCLLLYTYINVGLL